MEHFIRIAFWIVTLAVCCLNIQGNPLPLIEPSDWKLNLFESVTCVTGSEFYAPVNIKKECFINALECATVELQRTNTSEECTDEEKRIPQGLEVLEHAIKELKKKLVRGNSNKCACELGSLKNFTAFVADIRSLFVQINSDLL